MRGVRRYDIDSHSRQRHATHGSKECSPATKPLQCRELRPVPRPLPRGKSMASHGSVSHWISALKEGDSAAAQPLWERYYRQLLALARKKLRSTGRRAADEEDVVQNAFHSFFRAVDQGRFPQLDDRDSLWRLLVVITANKALKQLTYANRQKRGGGGTSAASMGISSMAPREEATLVEFVGDEPTPD